VKLLRILVVFFAITATAWTYNPFDEPKQKVRDEILADKRLDVKVNVSCKSRNLKDLFADLSAKTGVKLPVDPFSGKDLVYKRVGKGFQVYSISGNLRDDGGVPPKDHGDRDSGDIVVFWTH